LALWNLKIWLEEKMLLVIIFVAYDSTTVPNVHWKKSHCPFSWIFSTPKSDHKPKNKKNRHFSPIFSDKLSNWSMKSQDNLKTLLYQLVIMRKCHVWDFIFQFTSLSPKMGPTWWLFVFLGFFAILWDNKKQS